MAKTAAARALAFTGFPKTAPGFFHELAVEMNRDWFEDNKARYQSEWVTPMTALLDVIAAGIAAMYHPVALAPKIMRIHRDVRFSKDKSPYKTHIGGVLTLAGKSVAEGGNAAMYVHFGADEEFCGVGIYQFDAPRLARWRKAVAGKSGEPLARTVVKLRGAGYTISGHDDLKKVPRGFDTEHPRAELLKMRGLTAMIPEIPRGMLHQARLGDWLVGHGKALAPLVLWLHQFVK